MNAWLIALLSLVSGLDGDAQSLTELFVRNATEGSWPTELVDRTGSLLAEAGIEAEWASNSPELDLADDAIATLVRCHAGYVERLSPDGYDSYAKFVAMCLRRLPLNIQNMGSFETVRDEWHQQILAGADALRARLLEEAVPHTEHLDEETIEEIIERFYTQGISIVDTWIDDPLFPYFKHPLTELRKRCIVRGIEEGAMLTGLVSSLKLSGADRMEWVARLKDFARHESFRVAQRCFNSELLDDVIVTPWGEQMASTLNVVSSCAWPNSWWVAAHVTELPMEYPEDHIIRRLGPDAPELEGKESFK